MNDSLPTLDPKTTALLVMDYQTNILGMLGDATPLLARVVEAIGIARARGLQVGYVRVAFEDADFAAVPPQSQFAPMLKTTGQAFHAGAPGTAIQADVAPQPGDIVVRKTRVGAFSTTDLARQLRDRGIETIILAGISTSGVVLSTVRDAADRDYRILVLADACADRDPSVHEFLIEKIFPGQAQVIRVADLERLLPA